MLKIRKYPKRSPYWIIRGTVKGQPIFESSGTIDRREAEEFRRKREASLYEQIALGRLRPTTFADAVVAYINSGGEKKYLLKLLEYFGEMPLAEIRQY